MAGIAAGRQLTLRWDGHGFVPNEPVDYKEGQVVTMQVVASKEAPDTVPPKYEAVIGTIHAPADFNWDYDREDLYQDVA